MVHWHSHYHDKVTCFFWAVETLQMEDKDILKKTWAALGSFMLLGISLRAHNKFQMTSVVSPGSTFINIGYIQKSTGRYSETDPSALSQPPKTPVPFTLLHVLISTKRDMVNGKNNPSYWGIQSFFQILRLKMEKI